MVAREAAGVLVSRAVLAGGGAGGVVVIVDFTHNELVSIAEKWLLNTKGCSFVFTELRAYTRNSEIPDAIGWRSGYTILVECKVSRSDFLADQKKFFRQRPNYGMGTFRFYLCPEGLVSPDELPDKWGLVFVNGNGKAVQRVGPKGNIWTSKENKQFMHEKDHVSETDMMISALRRLHLRGVLPLIYDNPFSDASTGIGE